MSLISQHVVLTEDYNAALSAVSFLILASTQLEGVASADLKPFLLCGWFYCSQCSLPPGVAHSCFWWSWKKTDRFFCGVGLCILVMVVTSMYCTSIWLLLACWLVCLLVVALWFVGDFIACLLLVTCLLPDCNQLVFCLSPLFVTVLLPACGPCFGLWLPVCNACYMSVA